jgi:hypothetical protein
LSSFQDDDVRVSVEVTDGIEIFLVRFDLGGFENKELFHIIVIIP